MKERAYLMAIIAAVQAVSAFFAQIGLLFYSGNNAYAVRCNFLKACLEKDAEYYDKNNPNSMPSLL